MGSWLIQSFAGTDIVSGPLPYALLALSGGLTGVLITQAGLRRRQDPVRRLTGVLLALAVGIAVGALAYCVFAIWWNPFGIPIPRTIAAYAATCGGFVAIAALSLQRARWWRSVLAALTLVVVLLTGAIASIAAFGVDPTLGSLFGVTPTSAYSDQGPFSGPFTGKPFTDIAKSWKAPHGMPTHGRTHSVRIPPTHSGFTARDAGVYLPPAALVTGAPRLPLMILMMGQPGNPDPQYVAAVLDGFAARNHGLAPIVVVADQLGDPNQDPGCTDSARFGKVETYVTVDVLDWARQHLNVDPSGATTTIAGYSNGGACALLYAAKYPDDFRNVVDISGELFPGAEDPSAMLDSVFGGDQAAYDAQKPATVLAGRRYEGLAVFTAGSDDPVYVQAARQARLLFQRAGFTTEFAEVPNGGHVLGAINGGFKIAFAALYPALGLRVAAIP